jgi:uncharacterized protein YcbK (DUF882 family)
MTLCRRRLLQLGFAASAGGMAGLPAEAWAKSRKHPGHHPSVSHGHSHAARHGSSHALARQSAHHGPQTVETYPAPNVDLASALGHAPRRLRFHNLHTDEKLEAVYWEDGRYVPDALQAVNHVLRDFRTGDVHVMDPSLLDLVSVLAAKLETASPVHIISGYRSPQTNALLRAEGGAETGVAKKSLHLQGQAMDLRLSDVPLAHLHQAALSLGAGGVGYYPVSNFVHVDVGAVRHWAGV